MEFSMWIWRTVSLLLPETTVGGLWFNPTLHGMTVDDGGWWLIMVDHLSQDSSWLKSRLTPITTAFTRTTKAGLKDHNSPQWNSVFLPCEKLQRKQRSSKACTRTPRWRSAECPPRQRMDLGFIEFINDTWKMIFFCMWQRLLHYNIQYNLNMIWCMICTNIFVITIIIISNIVWWFLTITITLISHYSNHHIYVLITSIYFKSTFHHQKRPRGSGSAVSVALEVASNSRRSPGMQLFRCVWCLFSLWTK